MKTDGFMVGNGLKQWDGLAPNLFNTLPATMEDMMSF
jgi:hypothetical protein